MIFAWMGCVSWGIFLSRYYKHRDWWFKAHIILQSIAAVTVLASFIVIVAVNDGIVDDWGGHQVSGVMTFILLGLQVLLGIWAHYAYKPDRTSVPFFPDRLHWWTGRLTWLMAVIAIFYGIRLQTGTKDSWGFPIVWLVVTVVTVLYKEYMRLNDWRRATQENGQATVDDDGALLQSRAVERYVRDRFITIVYFLATSACVVATILTDNLGTGGNGMTSDDMHMD